MKLTESQIAVMKGSSTIFTVPAQVYTRLFEHTIVRRRVPYLTSLDTGRIQISIFIELCRKAEVPYPLFLSTVTHVEKLITDYEKHVFYGVDKTNLALSSRGDVTLADISLILKDLTRKQNIMKKQIKENNEFPYLFVKSKSTIRERATKLRERLGYDISRVGTLSKEESYSYLRECLGAKNIYVSLYMHNFCPQQIPKILHFSGICIRDDRCPIIFVRAGDNDSAIEPWGRRLFTTALMLACMVNGKFGAVTLDGMSRDIIKDEQYELAEEILMPAEDIGLEQVSTLAEITTLADKYSVSPSAMVMRLFRLNKIEDHEKNEFLDTLADKFAKLLEKKGGGNPPKTEKAITQYNSPSIVREVLRAVDNKTMSERDARNLLYYQKGAKFNIEDLRGYVQ